MHRPSVSGTIILAEEMATPQAHRLVPVVFLPSANPTEDPRTRYGVTVIRTLTAIKFYGQLRSSFGPKSTINFSPAWSGALTEATEAISRVTRDNDDPSPHLPFWDKMVTIACQGKRALSARSSLQFSGLLR